LDVFIGKIKMTEILRKELIKIAHSYGVKCRFSKRIKIPEADVHGSAISLRKDHSLSKSIVLSDFFHELGHVIDYRKGLYKPYYKMYPTKKSLRRFALQAELHTDLTGSKLMKQYFPERRFIFTYKYKKWQKFLKNYWGIE
jgi:hypothetical protein